MPAQTGDRSEGGAHRGEEAAPASAPFIARLQTLARRRAVRIGAAVVMLGFFAVNALVVARTDTPTIDEFAYLPTGYYHLRTGDLTFDTTNPPLLKMTMALPLLAMNLQLDTDPRWRDNRTGWGPWIFGTRFMNLNRGRYLDAFFAGRAVVVALGVALGVLVLARARELLSPLGALAALLLYATMSPLIAHSAVATLDMGVTALLFAAFLTLDRFIAIKTWPWAAATGVLLGLAFTAKGVTALFLPLVGVLAALEWRGWQRAGVVQTLAGFAVMGIAAWIAVLAVYGFSGFPLPAPLVEGVRYQLKASGTGEYRAFLNGQWSQTGWWYYNLVVLLVKTPLASLALLLVGAVALCARRLRERGAVWLILPPLFLLYVLSFHYGKNYGIRYLLPAFPFFVLLAGRGVDTLLRWGRSGAIVVAVLLAWQLAACTIAAPSHLGYFNELAMGPDRARHLLIDSNIDWGQDLGRLKTYLAARGTDRICLGYFGHVDPQLYGIQYSFPAGHPEPGLCAVSVNYLAGYPYAVTYAERIRAVRDGAWSWFDRLRPVARVGSSILVFDVTARDVASLSGAPPAGDTP